MNSWTITAALLSFFNLAWFANQIFRKKITATNSATWMMWVILDSIILGSNIETGKPYFLALSYVAGATPVFVAHLKMGSWKWTRRETFSAIVAILATVIWQTTSANWGVIAGVLAMTSAGIPLLLDLRKKPDSNCFWVFGLTSIACLLTIISIWPWTVGGTALAFGGILYNGYLANVCFGEPEDPYEYEEGDY
jgi:hypothetical protein